jgi:solute carrier family 25 (mitochondrial carnitine/acylcarnitine transporter), member 20/29
MVDATKKTIQAEGLSGLYKGVASPLAGLWLVLALHRFPGMQCIVGSLLVTTGMMLFNAVQFAAYSKFRDLATDGGSKETGLRFTAAGAITGAIVTVVEGPQDLIKSQMQQTMLKSTSAGGTPQYSSTLDCVKQVREGGAPCHQLCWAWTELRVLSDLEQARHNWFSPGRTSHVTAEHVRRCLVFWRV